MGSPFFYDYFENEIIRRVNRESGATIIMITHSLSQARRLSDRIVFMKDGKVIETGETKKVLNAPDKTETKEFLEFFGSDK